MRPKLQSIDINGFLPVRLTRRTTEDPRHLRWATNAHFRDPIHGGAVWPRPSFVRHASTQLGSGAAPRFVNLIADFWLSGTLHRIIAVSGIVYDDESAAVTAANFTTAGITVSATAQWSAIVLNGQLVVSDGTNTPFMWDGTAGAGGLTSLTNCPVLFGGIVNYYGKVFGIKNSDPRTLVWSEENDPTTGYDAGNYTNTWTLTQSDSDRLMALAATNEALTVFRTSGITLITGAVTPDFQTTGVRNGISDAIGTRSPYGASVADNGVIWFTDQNGRPNRIIGGKIDPIWRHMEQAFQHIGTGFTGTLDLPTLLGSDLFPSTAPLPSFALYRAQWAIIGEANLAIWVTYGTSSSVSLFPFTLDTGEPLGQWIPYNTVVGSAAAAASFNYSGDIDYPTTLFLVSQNGYVFRLASNVIAGLTTALGTDQDEAAATQTFQYGFSSQVLQAPDELAWHLASVRFRHLPITTGAFNVVWNTASKYASAGAPSSDTTISVTGSDPVIDASSLVGIDNEGGPWFTVGVYKADDDAAVAGFTGLKVNTALVPRDAAVAG